MLEGSSLKKKNENELQLYMSGAFLSTIKCALQNILLAWQKRERLVSPLASCVT